MRMTKDQMRNAAMQVADNIFESHRAEGNRFYVYKDHYYIRLDSWDGWLVDLSNHSQVMEDLEYDGRIRSPWTKYKALISERLLHRARSIAQPIDTSGVSWEDVVNPHYDERTNIESFVNACDTRNRIPMKGN